MRRLERYTARTITSALKLRAELQRIRAQGYATGQAEWREDVGGVCAPIRQSDGTVIAALGVSGPVARFKPADIKAHLPHVLDATREISARLGYLAEERYGLSID